MLVMSLFCGGFVGGYVCGDNVLVDGGSACLDVNARIEHCLCLVLSPALFVHSPLMGHVTNLLEYEIVNQVLMSLHVKYT